jgi:electron transfer flavoprotein alpha subunit
MRILVFLEHAGSEIQKNNLGVLTKAASLGVDVAGVVIGNDVSGLVDQAGRYGASTVYVADDAALAAPLPQPRVDVIAQLAGEHSFDAILFASSVLSADIASGLAARLDAGLNWGLADLAVDGGRLVGTQPALGDSVYVLVGWKGGPAIGLVRSGSFEPKETGGSAQAVPFSAELSPFSTSVTLIEHLREASPTGPAIEEADIIVAGGRGLGKPENFSLLESLARELGGAVGATRAVVDAGWYPYATQVGQTGKSVAPKLYVAAGISGAIQHKVGMQSSGTIVAINKDGNAPIFEFSDFGVVGDLTTIVPQLTELVKARKAG